MATWTTTWGCGPALIASPRLVARPGTTSPRSCGGKSRARRKLLAGPPELLVETCWSSAAIDLHQKLELYERAGVPEYVVVIVKKKQLRWHRLARGKYERIRPDAEGVYRSRVFPGLWLDSKALFKGDITQVLAKLHEGIASEEHRRFVQKLAARQR
jgi:Uma2 family endonuclease